jgi:hypothetical protein
MSTKLDAPDMVSFFYQSGKERKFPPTHTSKPYQPDISQLNNKYRTVRFESMFMIG